ncbi:MAG TPA: YceI family protein [Flavobacteriia bacterium]|nr:YceI family protein [Flavobacteriia bacterium]
MKTIYTITILLLFSIHIKAQNKLFTKKGKASFFSHSIMEDIKAENNQVVAIVDKETGKFKILMLMRSFIFKKALMQEHFNENYIESDKYPKAIYIGTIQNFSQINANTKRITFIGVLSIHGENKETKISANSVVTNDGIQLTGDFMLVLADYNIKIPSIVKNKIAEEVKVEFDLNLKPYKK